MKKKIIMVNDADIYYVLNKFNDKEREVIDRFNNELGKAIGERE